MRCRLCVSPDVGSTDSAGWLNASCARRIPRREGLFLLCCTAMTRYSTWCGSALAHHVPQVLKRSLYVSSRCFALHRLLVQLATPLVGMSRNERQCQQRLVLDQPPQIGPRGVGDDRLVATRLIGTICAYDEHSEALVDLGFDGTHATLASQRYPPH